MLVYIVSILYPQTGYNWAYSVMEMTPTRSIHIRLPLAHLRLLDMLVAKMGLDRTSILKLALYRLGLEEGFVLDYREE